VEVESGGGKMRGGGQYSMTPGSLMEARTAMISPVSSLVALVKFIKLRRIKTLKARRNPEATMDHLVKLS